MGFINVMHYLRSSYIMSFKFDSENVIVFSHNKVYEAAVYLRISFLNIIF